MGALRGIRVLELGGGKTLAYAGKLLRDLGADVVKVEPPSGDLLRSYGPHPDADAPQPQSGLFAYLNAGKRGFCSDPYNEGLGPVMRLLDGADVLLHSLTPSEGALCGLVEGDMLSKFPQLVVTAITTFGWTGPYANWRGYALHAQAGSGVAIRTGRPGRPPLVSPMDQAEIQHGAVHAAAASILAIIHRNQSGHGQFVDISTMESVTLSVSGLTFPNVLYGGMPPPTRTGRHFGPAQWGIYETRDGFFDVLTLVDRQWHNFVRLMGDPSWAANPPYNSVARSLYGALSEEEISTWRRELATWFASRTNAEIWAATRAAKIPFQPVQTISDVVESDQARERGLLVRLPGVSPDLRVPRSPFLMSPTPVEQPGPPPLLSVAEPAWIDRDDASDTPAIPRWHPSKERLPLQGIRIIDLTQVWAGPLLVRYLADFGAEAIMVETRKRPRTIAISETDGVSLANWESFYRNRSSLCLDLTKPEAIGLFKRLLSTADVLVDNFAPRVMPSLGLAYEELAAENPGLVIAALSATGRTGPWSDLLTYGPTLTALYGAKHLTGYPPDDLVEDVADLDPVSAGYGALAVLAALHHRARTGEGQIIEIAQGELALAGLAEAVIEWTWNGRDTGPQGNSHRLLAPHGIYPCSGTDQWVAIACGDESEWRSLAAIARHQEWVADGRFRTAAHRRTNASALDSLIASWSREHERYELARLLQSEGVAALPVMDILDIVSDEHHSARRRHFQTGPDFPGDELYDAHPWHMSATSPTLRVPVPQPGADSDRILKEIVGLTEEEIRIFREKGIVE